MASGSELPEHLEDWFDDLVQTIVEYTGGDEENYKPQTTLREIYPDYRDRRDLLTEISVEEDVDLAGFNDKPDTTLEQITAFIYADWHSDSDPGDEGDW